MDKATLSKLSPMARKFLKEDAKTDAEKQSQPSFSIETTEVDDKPSFPWPYDITDKGWYFFYGTLMDSSTLAKVLQVAEPPRLRPARVIGYEIRLWDHTLHLSMDRLAMRSRVWHARSCRRNIWIDSLPMKRKNIIFTPVRSIYWMSASVVKKQSMAMSSCGMES